MPGDSAIEELNLRLGPRKGQGRRFGTATRRLRGPSSRLSGSERSAAAEPTSHRAQKRYTEGVKQNPGENSTGGIKEQRTPRLVCVCVYGGGGGGGLCV